MEVYVGTICAFGFNYTPARWAQCQGQLVPISANTALFALLGTAYGGNGTTNFGLPNLQGCAAMGQGNNGSSTYVMGQAGGVKQMTLSATTMPAHSHSVSVQVQGKQASGSTASPANNYLAMPDSAGVLNSIYSATTNCNMAAPTVTLANTGGGNSPIAIESPYLGLNYSIALQGIFPQRS